MVSSDQRTMDSIRGHWSNKMEFFLAIMGYTVGIGNIWKFPFVCSRNGGGAFLIPFFFFLITSGGPLYYAEVCLGQFSGRSAAVAFGFCPLLKGLGFLQVELSLVGCWYAVFVSVWTYYYLYCSFWTVLPWSTCNNPWNTHDCRDFSANTTQITNSTTLAASNTTSTPISLNATATSPSFEFWKYNVIGKSSGLDEMGSLQPHLVICLAVAWTLTVLAVINGTKTLGKVVYASATLPFVFLAILFVRGLLLDGSSDGLIYFLKPDFSLLLKSSTWREAALQVFYSLGPSWGGVITMSSYNRFHQKSFWSSAMCVVCAGFAAFFNGLVVFTIIGFMANESGSTVEQLASQSGPGLVFVAFPTALSKLPFPQLWSVLFFLMLVAVTFDSIFGMFETITSGIIDLFPAQLLSKRIHVNICLGIFLIVTGLPLCMNGGIYILQLVDWYAPTFGLLSGACLECVALFWLYGIDRFCNHISIMTGRQTSTLLRIMWGVLIPFFTAMSFFAILASMSTPNDGDGYVYSDGYIAIGVLVGLVPVFGVVGCGATVIIRTKGTFMERLKASIQPDSTWRPNDEAAASDYVDHPYTYPESFKQRLVLEFRGPASKGDQQWLESDISDEQL